MSLGAPRIEVLQPGAERCPRAALPPEGNVKLRNYRVLSENLRAYTPTGDVHTSPGKGKLVARWEPSGAVSPPRARILELVRPEHEGHDALEAIVRPAPRRGLARPLDEDARRFLQRALLSPSPYLSEGNTPEPGHTAPAHDTTRTQSPQRTPPNQSPERSPQRRSPSDRSSPEPHAERSLAEELREAEEGVERLQPEARARSASGGAGERARLGRLALAVEEDEAGGALGAAARRLDRLLAESRALHAELHAIHEDLQVQSDRACRCAAAARGLAAESRALRYLDDVVALLKGDVKAAVRARAWPFAFGRRTPLRNYVI